ncbi:cardiotrophin-2 [Brienomyrus brachyistius]|uniref:cardiotrophin-2 n=1 Tax=Brienomyrus brachyistius TaxID=42636 RepID=UPI0020B25252|nr:cardiotrophin-2 [Brienomyrus brachyistius]
MAENKEQLGDRYFEDRDLTLPTLPSISTKFSDWQAMEDRDRLSQASHNLHIFWTHLDVKRRQLETEHQRQRVGKDSFLQGQRAPSIEKAMLSVQMDLRDLIEHVSAQLHRLNGTSVSGPTPSPVLDSTPLETSSSSLLLPTQKLWSSRLQGYVILRDLGRYMEKLVREFILLATKHHV